MHASGSVFSLFLVLEKEWDVLDGFGLHPRVNFVPTQIPTFTASLRQVRNKTLAAVPARSLSGAWLAQAPRSPVPEGHGKE